MDGIFQFKDLDMDLNAIKWDMKLNFFYRTTEHHTINKLCKYKKLYGNSEYNNSYSFDATDKTISINTYGLTDRFTDHTDFNTDYDPYYSGKPVVPSCALLCYICYKWFLLSESLHESSKSHDSPD